MGRSSQLPGGILRRGRARLALTLGGLALFLALSVLVVARWGLVTTRDWIWVWILLGLLAVSLADLRGWVRGMLRDWLPFMALILAYDLLRGVSDGLVRHAHSSLQIDFDRLLFGGHQPVVDLQRWLYHPHTHLHPHFHWYDYATWAVYTTHFFVTLVVAAVLWRVARERFRRFRAWVVALVFASIATFAVYPTNPPWIAGERHLIPHVSRVSLHVANHLRVHEVGAIFERGSHFANKVAAVPSLHAALPMLVLLFFWSGSRWWIRTLLAAYVLAMGFAVVYSGEHYVFDVLVGWIYAAGAAAAVEAAARFRLARLSKARPAPTSYPRVSAPSS